MGKRYLLAGIVLVVVACAERVPAGRDVHTASRPAAEPLAPWTFDTGG